MTNLLKYIIKRANLFIILILLITVFFGVKALSIRINPDFYDIFPDNSKRVEELFAATGIEDGLEMHLFFSVEFNEYPTVESVAAFHKVLKDLENHPDILSSISPFNFITFQKQGGRLSVEPIFPDKAPETADEVELFISRLNSEPLARDFLVANDGRVLNALFVTTAIDDTAEFSREFEELISPLEKYSEVYFSGDAIFSAHTVSYIQKDLLLLVILAILVILLVLFLSFRAFRAVSLPLITVAVGAIWSLGFSVLLGYQLTVVSVVLPTIVLAIGSSYAVHILSEYFRVVEGCRTKEENQFEVCVAVSHVVKTVILAGITTIIGFSSLTLTSINPLKEFGVSVSFGIIACVILTLFFLPALLSKFRPPRQLHKTLIEKDIFSIIIKKTTSSVLKYYKVFVAAFFVIIATAFLVYPKISRKVDYIDYFPSDDSVITDSIVINEHTGGGQTMNITLKAPEGTERYFLTSEASKQVQNLQNKILDNPNITSLRSYYTILSQINNVMFGTDEFPENNGLLNLLSRYFKLLGTTDTDLTYATNAEFINSDFSQMTIFLRVVDSATGRTLTDKNIKNLSDSLEAAVKTSLPGVDEYYIWGNTILMYEAGVQIQRDQFFSTLTSMILILLLTSIFFRSILKGILSLIPLIFAIAFNYVVMVIFRIPLDITTVLVSNVAIGVGVDDAIHFLLQYKRQQSKNRLIEDAVTETFAISGRPIILTTISIVAGFLMFCFASFKPITFFGILVSISLVAAMLSTLIFLPSFLLLFDKIKGRFSRKQDSISGV